MTRRFSYIVLRIGHAVVIMSKLARVLTFVCEMDVGIHGDGQL